MSRPDIYVSFAEATPRERLAAILDDRSFREVLGPFDRVMSPYLHAHGLVAQSDDGVIVGRGSIDGVDVAAVAIDGRFLGGSIGEIGGAKIAAVLECARGGAVIAFDTGGIRLQEANLGILALAEICDAMVSLRARAPVVGVIAGRIGCYGGMSLAASLCSRLIVSEGARFGLNGPEVVEQEAGLDELDARDRPLVWQLTGGARRLAQGLADELVADDVFAIAAAVRRAFVVPHADATTRTHPDRLHVLADDAATMPAAAHEKRRAMNDRATARISRGDAWSRALLEHARVVTDFPPSLRVIDGSIAGEAWRAIAIVPDAAGRFPRARGGECGVDEGIAIARAVREAPPGAAVLAVVDVPGQAFGRREEAAGIHVTLGAAVEAYATRRRGGGPIFALVVGKAISGAFLAHGLQAGWIGALDDADVEVHVMSAASVARVTRTSARDVARLAKIVPATARDIGTFARLGAIDEMFAVRDANDPHASDAIGRIRHALCDARRQGLGLRAPRDRRDAPAARAVRDAIATWWKA